MICDISNLSVELIIKLGNLSTLKFYDYNYDDLNTALLSLYFMNSWKKDILSLKPKQVLYKFEDQWVPVILDESMVNDVEMMNNDEYKFHENLSEKEIEYSLSQEDICESLSDGILLILALSLFLIKIIQKLFILA